MLWWSTKLLETSNRRINLSDLGEASDPLSPTLEGDSQSFCFVNQLTLSKTNVASSSPSRVTFIQLHNSLTCTARLPKGESLCEWALKTQLFPPGQLNC